MNINPKWRPVEMGGWVKYLLCKSGNCVPSLDSIERWKEAGHGGTCLALRRQSQPSLGSEFQDS